MTFKLLTHLTTASKMGKTEKPAHCGSIPDKTTPYDFYQYWRNTWTTRTSRSAWRC